jgi:hypothetical protein
VDHLFVCMPEFVPSTGWEMLYATINNHVLTRAKISAYCACVSKLLNKTLSIMDIHILLCVLVMCIDCQNYAAKWYIHREKKNK